MRKATKPWWENTPYFKERRRRERLEKKVEEYLKAQAEKKERKQKKVNNPKRPPRYNENGDRRCSSCKEYMPVQNFHKNSKINDGLSRRCKDCMRKYQQENMPKIVAKQYEWQKANPDKVKAYTQKYIDANREKIAARAKKFSKDNPGLSAKRTREYRHKHPEKAMEWFRTYAKKHPEIRTIKDQNRRARKLYNGGKISRKEWAELKDKYNYTCLCCGKREPEIKLTMDHVKALADGGKHSIENIQPLCKPCNSSKYIKHIDYRPLWREQL